MPTKSESDETRTIITPSGYVLATDADGKPIVPAVGEKVYRRPSILGDPFAGVACGALVACQHGLRWIGVELERRFCDLGRGCDCDGVAKADYRRWFGRWERADRHWCPRCLGELGRVDESGQVSMFADSARYVRNSGRVPEVEPHHYTGNLEKARLDGRAVLIQGDSRQFASLVGQCDAVVTSPPWAESLASGVLSDEMKAEMASRGHKPSASGESAAYGHTPGQIGSLKAGKLDAVVTSPPYADSVKGDRQHGIDWSKAGEATGNRKREGSQCDERLRQQAGGYGEAEGQIGSLKAGDLDAVVTSPPYADACSRRAGGCDKVRTIGRPGTEIPPSDYGKSDGQIGSLKAGDLDAVVTSPPYGNESIPGGDSPARQGIGPDGARRGGRTYRQCRTKVLTDSPQSGKMLADTQDTPDNETVSPGGPSAESPHLGIQPSGLASFEDSSWPRQDDARIAGQQSGDGADGASGAIDGISAAQAERKRPSTSGRSGQPITTCPTPGTTPPTTESGRAGMTAGEGSPGESSGGKRRSETATSASDVGKLDNCESITSKTKPRRAASGTIDLRTSKRSAIPATPRNTPSGGKASDTIADADIAAMGSEPDSLTLPSVASDRAEPSLEPKYTGDGTTGSSGLSCAENAAKPSRDVVAEHGIARQNVQQKQGPENSVNTNATPTYWSEMKLVYSEVRKALKPGGYLVVVVKDYVKAGKRVPLCDDTAKLLERLGFEVFERTRAHLVEVDEHPGLFGEPVVKKKERKSFFKRLAESKGSPTVDWEEVIWSRKS